MNVRILLAVVPIAVLLSIGMVASGSDAEVTFETYDGFTFELREGETWVNLVGYEPDKEYEVPDVVVPETIEYEGVEYNVVNLYSSFYQDFVKTVTIPKTVLYMEFPIFTGQNIEDVIIDEQNPVYSSLDGVIYADDMYYLVEYPQGKKGDFFQVPESVIAIANSAFAHCQLKEIVLPTKLLSIGTKAFSNSLQLAAINKVNEKNNLPSNVTVVDDYAFSNCVSLDNLFLSETLRIIGAYAFENTSLKEMIIPNSVSTIRSGAFSFCTQLEKIESPNNQLYKSHDGVLYKEDGVKSIVCYPAGKKDAEFTIDETVEDIMAQAFAGCKHLKKIDFQAFMYVIPRDAFADCESLVEINLESIVAIGDAAFRSCYNLETVGFGENLVSIGLMAFSKTKLKSVTITDSVMTVGAEAFEGCDDLELVIFSEQCSAEISVCTFLRCYNLGAISFEGKNVALQEGSLDVGDYNKTVNVLVVVPKEYNLPENVVFNTEYTVLDVQERIEPPYPYENFVGIFLCVLVLIGIFVVFRGV